jgi:hypothetical protein
VRLGALLLLVLVALVAYSDIGRMRGSPQDTEAATIVNESGPSWMLEALYLASTTAADTTYSEDERVRAEQADGDVVQILTLGDSYTYGTGLLDRNASWPARLEVQLAEELGTVVKVFNLGRPGLSLFGQVDLLRQWSACQEDDAQCGALQGLVSGDIDAIVLGLTANDFFPSPTDSIMQSFPSDVTGPWDMMKLSPYEKHVPDAARELANMLDGVPAYWMPLISVGSNEKSLAGFKWDPERWWPMFEGAGLERVETRRAVEAMQTLPVADLMVNPVDYHPSLVLHNAYALDAANALLPLLKESARERAELLVPQLLGTVLPSAEVIAEPNTTTVHYELASAPECIAEPADPTVDLAAPLRRSGLPVEGARCGTGRNLEVRIEDAWYPLPSQPCAARGTPFVLVGLNPYHAGRSIKASIADGEDIVLRAYGYLPDGRMALSEYTGATVDGDGLPSDAPLAGFFVESTRMGCSGWGRAVIESFSLRVNVS